MYSPSGHVIRDHAPAGDELHLHAYTDAANLASKLVRTGGTLVLAGGTVIDGTGRAPIPDAVVVVEDGGIAKVGPRASTTVPSGATVRTIDTTGRYLVPGLIDCHVHFTGDHVEISVVDGRRTFNETTTQRKFMEPIHSVRIIRSAANANLLLAAGFTTVRNLGHADAAHIAAVKAAIRLGLVAGPDIVDSGWAISQTGGHGKVMIWPYDLAHRLRPRSSFADGVAECVAHVRQNIREGADCIKIYTSEGMINAPNRLEGLSNYSPREIEAMVAEAHRSGLKVSAHAVTVAGTRSAVLGGVDTIEHGPHVLDEELLKTMRDRGTVLVPTLESYDFAATGRQDHVFGRWVAERAARRLTGRMAVVRRAYELGVPLALGTGAGAPPRGGRNTRELELLVEAGLTPLETLRVATQGSAAALGREREIGSIKKGRRADILVLRADPLVSIGTLRDQDTIERIVQPRYAGGGPA
ncbi:MAG: amidohydrolase family protein [Thermoleophilaceae bacterium]